MPVPKKDPTATNFSNWLTNNGSSIDTKAAASDLMKRGLVGADQIMYDNPNTNSPTSIKNSQADWKPAAIQEILYNIRRLGLKTPEEINANKGVLTSGKYKDAINNPSFANIHPNFWSTITNSIVPQQYAKESSDRLSAFNTPSTQKNKLISALNK